MRAIALGLAVAGLALTGCGSSDGREGAAADVPEAEHGELGTVEVATDGMHLIPLFLSDLSAEQDKDLVLDRTDDGYVLTATTPGRTYRIEVTEAPPTTADLDAIGPRALPHEDDVEADGELAWTTPLGTVAIRAEGASPEDLDRIAGSMVVVDDDAYAAWTEDPAADLTDAISPRRIAVGPRTVVVGFRGSAADSGAAIDLDGRYGFEGSLRNHATPQWSMRPLDDDRIRALVTVTHPIADVEGTDDWWATDDVLVGRLLVVEGATGDEVTLRYADGTAPTTVELDPLYGD